MTYYRRNAAFHAAFEAGRIEEAESLLSHDKKAEQRKTRLLYYMDRGVVLTMLGDYISSNEALEKAWLLSEDYQKNLGNEALSLLSNPNAAEYKGEDHELLLINYYKALNFMKLGDMERALVEVRRMNIRLNRLEDKYSSARRYKEEPFIELMMGLVYDAAGETNNAFIAYRNAYEAFDRQRTAAVGPGPPVQLKRDLLRTAQAMGFDSEVSRFEKKFGYKYQAERLPKEQGQLVFLWHNGLSPVKSEWSLNFTIVRGQGGNLTFVNEQMGLQFPAVFVGNEADQRASLTDLSVVRVAFPQYLERQPVYRSARLKSGSETKDLEMAMDVYRVATRSLQQRMHLEVGKAITRLAVKQALQIAARKGTAAAVKGDSKDEKKADQAEALGNLAGFAVGIWNAASEKADTRAWMTLPYSISYARMPLPVGKQSLILEAYVDGSGTPSVQQFSFDIKPGKTTFHSFHHIQHRPVLARN